MKRFTRRSALRLGGAALGLAIVPALGDESDGQVLVWKDPYCGCCGGWMAHMQANGFSVDASDVGDMDAIKDAEGVPPDLRSCHTARVGAYVIEGHVPAAAVRRLLEMRPGDVAGLAVAGMPLGSPGMAAPAGYPADEYDVVAFGNQQPYVFMRFAGEWQL